MLVTCLLGLLQEPYPKGLIPLSVIEMARPTKDNKFQVVTGHRIFVFRAESEGKKAGNRSLSFSAWPWTPDGTYLALLLIWGRG